MIADLLRNFIQLLNGIGQIKSAGLITTFHYFISRYIFQGHREALTYFDISRFQSEDEFISLFNCLQDSGSHYHHSI